MNRKRKSIRAEENDEKAVLAIPPTSDLTDLYWRDIKEAQTLSRSEEVELFKLAKSGNEAARQKIILSNLRFVVRVAREYKDYGLSLVELISEGNFGLLEAVKRFDETRGFKFITYAVWWIRQAILKALAEQGKIAKPPLSQINDQQRMDKQAGALAHQLGRSPTFEEISESVDISAERTKNAWVAAQQDLFLDAPAFQDEEAPLMTVFAADQPGGDDDVMQGQLEHSVRACLQLLDDREYQIVSSYFGFDDLRPMTLEEIGETLGVTRERVRQLRNRALDKLRVQCGELLLEFSSN